MVQYFPRGACLTAGENNEIGKQVSHGTAKEILVGLATAEAEKLIEKKGLGTHEGERAKHATRQNAEWMYEQYNNGDQYNPNSQGPPGPLEQRGEQRGGYERRDYERRDHDGGRYERGDY